MMFLTFQTISTIETILTKKCPCASGCVRGYFDCPQIPNSNLSHFRLPNSLNSAFPLPHSKFPIHSIPPSAFPLPNSLNIFPNHRISLSATDTHGGQPVACLRVLLEQTAQKGHQTGSRSRQGMAVGDGPAPFIDPGIIRL